jgi:hypothetical protein
MESMVEQIIWFENLITLIELHVHYERCSIIQFVF